MSKVTKSLIATALVAISASALVGLNVRPAVAIEPNSASEIVALFAGTGVLQCPFFTGGAAFVEVGPDGAEEEPFALPANTVLVVTSFNWQGNGGEPSVLSQAQVISPAGTGARAIIRSSAIAGVKGYAGATDTFPTGVVLRASDGAPLCLFTQQLNETLIGTAFLYGFLAKDK